MSFELSANSDYLVRSFRSFNSSHGVQNEFTVLKWPAWRMRCGPCHVCFSNRPFGVKRFQTIHYLGVDVARGLVLLFGIGTRALPSWDSKTRRNNLSGGLAVSRTAEPSRHTNSPHPSSREGHLSTARWISGFLLSHRSYVPFRLPRFAPWSSGTRCRQPRCGA